MRTRLLAALPLAALSMAFLAGCASDEPAESSAEGAAPAGACQYDERGAASKEVDAPSADPVEAVLSTSIGDITIDLDADRAPCTVNSFASLSEQDYYNDTSCHRLTTSGIFVLQCGDPTGTGTGGPGYSYADELDGSETYEAGTVAMANAGPDTNGSQFFLVYDDTVLGPDYTVFGHMDEESTALVAQVAADGTESGLGDGVPATPVDITAVTIG
jgi:peptidyl-prolyl cis-trans isomerase B (cyclophilin B)